MSNQNVIASPDPLAKLYTDRVVSARELAEFLLTYIRINPETLRIGYFDGMRLSIEQKLLLYFLALKVMSLQKLRDGYRATPSQLADDLKDLNPSSVRPILRNLVTARLLSYDDETSEYFITANQVNDVEKYIQKKDR